ncbi:MAG: S1-like domain-containing RNA-binding protein [Kiritimatiellae bacterium]|nr:S1-like domain-containing RNA-binding protein [Kiritimatiellia bacterium]
MPEYGKMNQLTVMRVTDVGLFLDGEDLGDILLPRRYAKREWEAGEVVDVFLMRDSDDRPLATTLTPYAMVGDFACLRVVAVAEVGSFMDWGLPKDLFVPFREQKMKMLEGRSYVVRVYVDKASGRIAASSRLERYLDKTTSAFKIGQPVSLMISEKSDLGYKAIINNTHSGMLFYEKVVLPLELGQCLDAFIEQVREDGKINLSLAKPGYDSVADVSTAILAYLDTQDGLMTVTDKSSRQEIFTLFGVSKKTYKKALGALYKARKIAFEEEGVKRLDPPK